MKLCPHFFENSSPQLSIDFDVPSEDLKKIMSQISSTKEEVIWSLNIKNGVYDSTLEDGVIENNICYSNGYSKILERIKTSLDAYAKQRYLVNQRLSWINQKYYTLSLSPFGIYQLIILVTLEEHNLIHRKEGVELEYKLFDYKTDLQKSYDDIHIPCYDDTKNPAFVFHDVSCIRGGSWEPQIERMSEISEQNLTTVASQQ